MKSVQSCACLYLNGLCELGRYPLVSKKHAYTGAGNRVQQGLYWMYIIVITIINNKKVDLAYEFVVATRVIYIISI